jgi:hypothetical protein
MIFAVPRNRFLVAGHNWRRYPDIDKQDRLNMGKVRVVTRRRRSCPRNNSMGRRHRLWEGRTWMAPQNDASNMQSLMQLPASMRKRSMMLCWPCPWAQNNPAMESRSY